MKLGKRIYDQINLGVAFWNGIQCDKRQDHRVIFGCCMAGYINRNIWKWFSIFYGNAIFVMGSERSGANKLNKKVT